MIKKILGWSFLAIIMIIGVLIINLVIFEKRSDGKKMPVIYVRNEVSNPLINVINNTMARGSVGAQLDGRLSILSDYIISKEKQDAFSNPMLDSVLIENKINRLFIVGLDAAYCVNSTIDGALSRGYDIAVIGDLILSETDSLKRVMFDEYANKQVDIISSDIYLQALEEAKPETGS